MCVVTRLHPLPGGCVNTLNPGVPRVPRAVSGSSSGWGLLGSAPRGGYRRFLVMVRLILCQYQTDPELILLVTMLRQLRDRLGSRLAGAGGEWRCRRCKRCKRRKRFNFSCRCSCASCSTRRRRVSACRSHSSSCAPCVRRSTHQRARPERC
jgi:hypothetical protein